MKFRPSLLLASTLAASLVCAESLSHKNVENVHSIIGDEFSLQTINERTVSESDLRLAEIISRVEIMQELHTARDKEAALVNQK